VELVVACVERAADDELECVPEEPLPGDELPWVAANATPPPPSNARVAAAAASVVRLDTMPPFVGLLGGSNQRLLGGA
jgi:hypothetical protein